MTALWGMVHAVRCYIAGTLSRLEMVAEILGGWDGHFYVNCVERESIMRLFLESPHTITRFPQGADDLMKIYMAGGVSGNLKPYWSDIAKGKSKDEAMQIFLAGGHINGKYQFHSHTDKAGENINITGSDGCAVGTESVDPLCRMDLLDLDEVLCQYLVKQTLFEYIFKNSS